MMPWFIAHTEKNNGRTRIDVTIDAPTLDYATRAAKWYCKQHHAKLGDIYRPPAAMKVSSEGEIFIYGLGGYEQVA